MHSFNPMTKESKDEKSSRLIGLSKKVNKLVTCLINSFHKKPTEQKKKNMDKKDRKIQNQEFLTQAKIFFKSNKILMPINKVRLASPLSTFIYDVCFDGSNVM